MTNDPQSSIGKALGRVPSGVFILTATHDGRHGAMLASWVMQAGFDPPAVTVALARGRPIAQTIRDSGRMALSILPADDTSLMKHYARGADENDPFAGVTTQPTPSGIPVLRDALGWLDCDLVGVHDFGGDHELFIGRITAACILRESEAFTHQRGNGFHY